jgi:hypothetical protein
MRRSSFTFGISSLILGILAGCSQAPDPASQTSSATTAAPAAPGADGQTGAGGRAANSTQTPGGHASDVTVGAPTPDGVPGPAANPSTFDCYLEYETFSPSWATAPVAHLAPTLDAVKASAHGVSAFGGRYGLRLAFNPKPPYNLSFEVAILDTLGNSVAYNVLPSPQKGGAYLFELGGRIDPTTAIGDDGSSHSFDFLRGYCSLR